MIDRYAIIFSSDMSHPLYINAKTFEEFYRQLYDIVLKYGKFEIIYRVY